jgi:arylformamidase
MEIIDLTHTILPEMPVFPGDTPPDIKVLASVETDGFAERRLELGSHTGTHIDSPAHILLHSPTLDRIPPDRFIGRGSVIDLTEPDTSTIDIGNLQPHEERFKNSDFVLFRTGWSRLWGQEQYFENFPVLSIEAALWIHSFELKGIGIDAPSVDETLSTDCPIHKILLERLLIIENLTNLKQLPETGFTFSCFPLKYENADGSPVRAVGII